MKQVAEHIHGYTYGAAEVPVSPVTLEQLVQLQISVGFTDEDQRALQLAGEVLGDQTKQIVEHWRSKIIASIPHLARHSRSLEGDPLPVQVIIDNDREAGRGYYRELCFKINIRAGAEWAEVGDGGFTDWTARLTASNKERLLISGVGIDRVVALSSEVV